MKGVPADPAELDDVLLDQVRARTRPERTPRLADNVVALVRSHATEDRAWALVKLAADFRALGDLDAALRLLDTAWQARPGGRAERAIFTVAVAVHCDAGRHEVAETLAREQSERSTDALFAMAAARVHAELWAASGLEEHALSRDRFLALAEAEAALASA
jgi:hypothetical protein